MTPFCGRSLLAAPAQTASSDIYVVCTFPHGKVNAGTYLFQTNCTSFCLSNMQCNVNITDIQSATCFDASSVPSSGMQGTVYLLCSHCTVCKVCLINRILHLALQVKCVPGCSVGIATGYGLDGTGIESQWERDFPHPSGLALRPTQPPIQWLFKTSTAATGTCVLHKINNN